ncbi:MAG: CRISPR-associated protein Cas4 [Thermus sp.]|nr:CRISPR-associated protein Cas4 [Thermus sp.]
MGVCVEEDSLIPISALQHYAYCPRQFALIHIEQEWRDNLFTYMGTLAHKTIDEPSSLTRQGMRVEYGLPLFSERLGLVGKADVVEFPQDIPYPVERKLSRRKSSKPDEIQLCAQAMCLEEMFQ